MRKFRLRKWQEDARDIVYKRVQEGNDRALIYACPGAGKTIAGLEIARGLIDKQRLSRFILVVTPNEAIRSQWIARAKMMGIDLRELRGTRELSQETLPSGVEGFVLSYQKTMGIVEELRRFVDRHMPVVLLDEVHHTGLPSSHRVSGNEWGRAINAAFEAASFKLCTTGTPFRQDNYPIAFVSYNDEGKVLPDFSYSYKDAVNDGVCRPIEFEFYDGDTDFIDTTGIRRILDFTDRVSKKLSRQRLHAALKTEGDFPLTMLTSAHALLTRLRETGDSVDARAGGLVVAIDVAHAEAIADVLETISGKRPTIVHNRVDDAQRQIEEFRNGDAEWMVGIRMLSEGVDIPRLRVGVYATNVSAPLYFHQFCGRFSRVQESKSERAFVVLPRDERIHKIAREIEQEICHRLSEDRIRAREARFGGRGTARDVVVNESESRSVATVIGGVEYTAELIESMQPEIRRARAGCPWLRDLSDAAVCHTISISKAS